MRSGRFSTSVAMPCSRLSKTSAFSTAGELVLMRLLCSCANCNSYVFRLVRVGFAFLFNALDQFRQPAKMLQLLAFGFGVFARRGRKNVNARSVQALFLQTIFAATLRE